MHTQTRKAYRSVHGRNLLRRFALAGCLLFAPWVLAVDPETILQRVDQNMMPDSFEMYRKLVYIEQDGRRREFVMYTIKQGRDRVANLFLTPGTEKGKVTLRLGKNMWLVLPQMQQPLRVTSVHSAPVGGIFNNWDLMRLELSTEFEAQGMTDLKLEYVLELKANTDRVPYDRLKLWVDKEQLLPKRLEAYAVSGLHMKTVHFKAVKDFGDGIVRPSVIETESPLRPDVKAMMLFSEIRRRVFPQEVFTINYMHNLNGLR